MQVLKVVNRGVDTLMVNLYHTDDAGRREKRDLGEALHVQLEGLKREAQAAGEPIVTAFFFNGLPLLMQPNGALHGQFPWMLKTKDITLYVSTGSWNGIGAVRFSSEFLWSCQGLLHAVVLVQDFVNEFFADEMYLQVSAVDLCADIAGWQGVEQLDKRRDFVSRSFKRAAHAEADWGDSLGSTDYVYGLQVTGLDFSRGGPVSLVIYDKSREIKKSQKDWFFDLWRSNGWSEDDGCVWRVELRYKREALHELLQEVDGLEVFHGVEDVYVFLDLLPLLWAYGVGSVDVDGLPGWLRCVVPGTDKIRSRWPTHPVWKVVQAAFSADDERPADFGKVVRKRHRDHHIDRMVEAMVGYASSLAAHLGGEYGKGTVDLSMVLHWLAEAGPEYLERVDRDFGEEVGRKRILFQVRGD